MYTVEDINKAKQHLSEQGYGTGSNFTLNTVANLMAEWAAKNCSIPVVSPRLFYVVAPSQYEEGNLEQITNGLTYDRAVAYRDGDFCKNRWPNAYILASLNEG